LTAPILIVGIGNPSRGDDALGPLLVERLTALNLAGIELLTDFQLQIAYAIDLQGREKVIFVDASIGGAEPYQFKQIEPAADSSYSSHALSPAALLQTYRQLYGEPPAAWVLAIRGYEFELGKGLSPQAVHNLEQALSCMTSSCATTSKQKGHHDG